MSDNYKLSLSRNNQKFDDLQTELNDFIDETNIKLGEQAELVSRLKEVLINKFEQKDA